MLSYWAYILIGNDKTGKTSFQRHLIADLCGREYDRLPTNTVKEINHPKMPRGVETISTMNRSYQEKISEYGTVENFFKSSFQEASICILSSHTDAPSIAHIRDMIRELRLLTYNVAGVFFSNGYNTDAAEISLLDWDEHLWIDNPTIRQKGDDDEHEKAIQKQILQRTHEFSDLLVRRAGYQ